MAVDPSQMGGSGPGMAGMPAAPATAGGDLAKQTDPMMLMKRLFRAKSKKSRGRKHGRKKK